jgi:hypothetical protein
MYYQNYKTTDDDMDGAYSTCGRDEKYQSDILKGRGFKRPKLRWEDNIKMDL